MGQITAAVNVPSEISNKEFGPDNVKIVVSFYVVETGGFKGLKDTAGFISIKGDVNETFSATDFLRKILKMFTLVKKEEF